MRRLWKMVSVGVGVTVVALAMVRAQGGGPGNRYRPIGWGSEATLAVRADEAGGVVLTPGTRFVEPPTRAPREAAYRLDLQSMALEPVSLADWQAAPGAVVQCERAGLAPSVVSVDSGRLRIDGRALPISGTVRAARLDPAGRFVAVVTALGVTIPGLSFAPGLSGSSLIGWARHQLVDRETRMVVGPSVALGFGTTQLVPCWSPGGETVIYANPAFTDVALISVRR